MPFQTVVASPIHEPVLTGLRALGDVVINKDADPWSPQILRAQCKDADALMVFMTEKIDDAFLNACGNLKIIAGALKGYNNIDVDACTRAGVLVTIVPDLLTEPTAELTLGMMISVARNMRDGDQHVRHGDFAGWRPRFYGSSLNGARVAVIGAGAVGQAILRMLSGFECERVYVDKAPLAPNVEASLRARQVTLEDARTTADFVVLALHLMPETTHLVDEAFLAGMKRGSYLINPARGSLVDEAAVSEALHSGHLAGYAADTFEMEDWARTDRPRTIDPRLLASPQTVLTPHIGSAVTTVRQAIEQSAADSIAAVARGHVPPTAVNLPRKIA